MLLQVAYRATRLRTTMSALSGMGLPLPRIVQLVRDELDVVIGLEPQQARRYFLVLCRESWLPLGRCRTVGAVARICLTVSQP